MKLAYLFALTSLFAALQPSCSAKDGAVEKRGEGDRDGLGSDAGSGDDDEAESVGERDAAATQDREDSSSENAVPDDDAGSSRSGDPNDDVSGSDDVAGNTGNTHTAELETADAAEDAGPLSDTLSDDGSNGEGSPFPQTGNTATIGLYQSVISVMDAQAVNVSASAQFGPVEAEPAQEVEGACQITQRGSCNLSVCDLSAQPEATPPTQVIYADAGTLTVSGLLIPVELLRDAVTGQYVAYGNTRYWNGNETATIEVSGSSGAPTFSLELLMPSNVIVTYPVINLSSAVNVAKSVALDVTWAGGEVGEVNVSLQELGAQQLSRVISCSVAAAEGGVSVDALLLADLGADAFINVSVLSSATKTVEDWTVNALAASVNVLSGQLALSD